MGAEQLAKVHRLRLRKVGIVTRGFSERCLGCQALIAGTAATGDWEEFVAREEGGKRKEKREERENEILARHLAMTFGDGDANKDCHEEPAKQSGCSFATVKAR